MNNQAIVNTKAVAENVDQRTDKVDMVAPSYFVLGVLPFPIEVHGHSQLLLCRQAQSAKAGQSQFPVGIGDFAILPQGLGKR